MGLTARLGFGTTTLMSYAVAIVILASLPLYASPAHIFLVGKALTMAIFALGFNLILGYLGMVSFGHAAYYAVGAYTAALMITRLSIKSIEIVLPASIAASAVAAALIGFLCVRHTRIYFALLTLAFGQMIYSVLLKEYSITRGSEGIAGISKPELFGLSLAVGNNYYYFIIVIFALSLLTLRVIVNSPFGKILQAIRENAARTEFVGISIWKYRWTAFILSGIFSGIGGALFAPLTMHVSPELAYWTFSGEIVFITILGGHGLFEGPALGALVFEFLKYFALGQTIYWPIIVGSVLIFVVLVFPKGIAGTIVESVRRRLRK